MTDTFIMRGEWINHLESMPQDMQDKITAEICRYGVGAPLKYEDDVMISSFVNFVKGSIDASKSSYDKKVEMSKTAGRKRSIDNDKIYELAVKGYTAQEVADTLGISKSSVDKSEGWKRRKTVAVNESPQYEF